MSGVPGAPAPAHRPAGPAPPPGAAPAAGPPRGPPARKPQPQRKGKQKPPPPQPGTPGDQSRFGRWVWSLLVWGMFVVFILGPLLTVVAFSLTPSVFQGLTPRTGHWYKLIFTHAELAYPLLRSFEVALIVVVVQLVLGTTVAYASVRGRVFTPRLLDAASNLTIALPSIVIGLALLSFYGPFGPVAALTGLIFSSPLSLTFTLWIVVLAHVLETFPYMVRTVSGVLEQVPVHLEPAARSLGAGPFTVFRTVLLPQLRNSLVAGAVLVFSRSIAEFGATIVVVSAVLKTAPISIYTQNQSGSPELAAAYSVVLMVVSLLVYLGLRRQLRRNMPKLALRE